MFWRKIKEDEVLVSLQELMYFEAEHEKEARRPFTKKDGFEYIRHELLVNQLYNKKNKAQSKYYDLFCKYRKQNP